MSTLHNIGDKITLRDSIYILTHTHNAPKKEIQRIKQASINNGYSMAEYRHKYNATNTSAKAPNKTTQSPHKIYYINQMHKNQWNRRTSNQNPRKTKYSIINVN